MSLNNHNYEGEPLTFVDKFADYLVESSIPPGKEDEGDVQMFTMDSRILELIGGWDPESNELHPLLANEQLLEDNISHIRETGEYSPEFLHAMGDVFVEEIERRATTKGRIKKTVRSIKFATITYSLFADELEGLATTLIFWGIIDRALVRHADYLPAHIAFLEELLVTQLADREQVNFDVSALIRRGLKLENMEITDQMIERYHEYKRSIRELLELNFSHIRLRDHLSKHNHSPFHLWVHRSANAKGDEVLMNIHGLENQWRAFVVRSIKPNYPGLSNREILAEAKESVKQMRSSSREMYRQRRMEYFMSH